MILTCDLEVDRVMVYQHAKYLGQRSFNLKVICLDTLTCTDAALIPLPRLQKWFVNVAILIF